MAPTPTPRATNPVIKTAKVLTLRHCGFDLTIQTMQGRFGASSYAYSVLHRGHLLHESGGEFGTASGADKAARQLIDDALGMFDRSLITLNENDA